ncbi:MAG TPA: glycosyltransferase family 1 protein [Opitutaceae bacterium]|nr:glycosyltransferase family 1 protein [Opitutaceae bacterium]
MNARPEAPLHVAFPLGGTDLGRSGIGTYVREVLPPLISRLSASGGSLTAFGHPTELAAYASALQGARQHPVRVTAKPGPNALWHLLQAGPLARKLGADVLLLPAANRRLTARATVPTVAVVHDLAQLRVREKYDRLRMFYFHQVLMRGFRTATQLVAVSRATRSDLVGALRLPEDDVRVVYNGVNPDQFKGLDPAAAAVRDVRRALGLETRPYFFYPARLEHPGKNHVRLLRAFAQSRLAETHTLACAGSDWGGGELIRATVRELHLEDSVKFLGFVPSAQLPLLVSGADAVLMLGLHEGFGLPALEGLSAGRPVAVANTGALPEVVGDLGVQCDPLDESAIASALVRVVTDEGMRARCRAEGPAWAENFTWARTAGGLVDACHAAIATARR